MNHISLLQIGDVHFFDNQKKTLVDLKDPGVEANLGGSGQKKIQKIFRSIAQKLTIDPTIGIMICGDLASRGDVDEYDKCVKYIINALSLTGLRDGLLHVVPGNHDVNRELCIDRDKLNPKKFEPLQKSWKNAFSDVLTTNSLRSETVSSNGNDLKIFSMNSCIGCGEWRMLPPVVKGELGKLLEELDVKDEDSAHLKYEQLDTPMFAEDDVDKLSDDLQGLELSTIPVVLAHHNLLPQELRRIQIYTELINSGQIRSILTRSNRPIIYCHGHIHTDPIEVVSDGTKSHSQVICVSAPEIVSGFNELKIFYSSSNQPLGMEVIQFRINDNGTVTAFHTHKIKFHNREKFTTEAMDYLQKAVEGSKERKIRIGALREGFNKNWENEYDDKDFSALVREAEWFGFVDIKNLDRRPENWIIAKVEL